MTWVSHLIIYCIPY